MKQFLIDLSREAGRLALDYRTRLDQLDVRHKAPKDLVTEADTAVETFLVGEIRRRYPEHAILGEESGAHAGGDLRWVIDPIDGTNSFLHGQPFFSVSIALERKGQVVLGAVNAPVLDEFFLAEREGGATCNGRPIAVSGRERLLDAMLGTGFACVRNDLPRNNLPYFAAVLPQIRGIRRYGSVAIDLSYVACGRLEGFWELGLHAYDIAAAGLILEEAGGRLSDFRGGPAGLPGEMLGSNGRIHEALSAILQDVDRAKGSA